jgi:hypothetical protein
MNENKNITANTISVLNKKHAYNCCSGAFIVRGGVGIGDNLHVCNTITADGIIIKDRLKVCGDGIIDTLKVNDKLLPFDGSSCIGTKNCFWGKIFTNCLIANSINVNATMQATNIHSKNKFRICNEFIDSYCKLTLQDTTPVELPVDTQLTKHNILMTINLSEDVTYTLGPATTGTRRKFVVTINETEHGMCLNLNGIHYRLQNEDDYIEVIYTTNEWLFIGGNIRRI